MYFWRACFFLSIICLLTIVPFYYYIFTTYSEFSEIFDSLEYKLYSYSFMLPTSLLGLYALYFSIKFDRYSSALFYIVFLPFYPIWYYYSVIWKRQRELINKKEPIEQEPILGNRIKIESFDEEGNEIETY